MPPNGRPRRPRLAFETRLTLMALAAALPAMVVSLAILWFSGYADSKVQWTLTVLLVSVWLGFCFAVRERLVRPLQTLANLLAALQEGDYSIRARGSHTDDALDEVYREVNTLSTTLQEQRLGALEATALLRTVMSEIDVAVFTFDDQQRLRLVNRAGERLLGQSAQWMLGRSVSELGLADTLEGEPNRTVQHSFPGGSGRWSIRLGSFREGGRPHRLLVIEDLTRTLREEELQAWKRLVRVLGHELNNSMTPIRSIAGSLQSLIERDPPPADWRADTQRGLGIIASRSESLARFLDSYARLAKLPPPAFAKVDVSGWIRRIAMLETRVRVTVDPGPELTLRADPDQLDQLLINLVRNAADAGLETGGGVTVFWRKVGQALEVGVLDEGHGISNPQNLFVPFFTTKPGGSGIGLVLCRQIAEGHKGNLTLENRLDRAGAQAIFRLTL